MEHAFTKVHDMVGSKDGHHQVLFDKLIYRNMPNQMDSRNSQKYAKGLMFVNSDLSMQRKKESSSHAYTVE